MFQYYNLRLCILFIRFLRWSFFFFKLKFEVSLIFSRFFLASIFYLLVSYPLLPWLVFYRTFFLYSSSILLIFFLHSVISKMLLFFLISLIWILSFIVFFTIFLRIPISVACILDSLFVFIFFHILLVQILICIHIFSFLYLNTYYFI